MKKLAYLLPLIILFFSSEAQAKTKCLVLRSVVGKYGLMQVSQGCLEKGTGHIHLSVIFKAVNSTKSAKETSEFLAKFLIDKNVLDMPTITATRIRAKVKQIKGNTYVLLVFRIHYKNGKPLRFKTKVYH